MHKVDFAHLQGRDRTVRDPLGQGEKLRIVVFGRHKLYHRVAPCVGPQRRTRGCRSGLNLTVHIGVFKMRQAKARPTQILPRSHLVRAKSTQLVLVSSLLRQVRSRNAMSDADSNLRDGRGPHALGQVTTTAA